MEQSISKVLVRTLSILYTGNELILYNAYKWYKSGSWYRLVEEKVFGALNPLSNNINLCSDEVQSMQGRATHNIGKIIVASRHPIQF